MKTARFFSLLFAIALQAMPMCRVITSQFLPAGNSGAAIVMRWVVGGVALLGAFHAVSGASTVITSPLTARGTNGVAFSYRITTGPQAANQFNASPLPSGLTVSTSTGRITGTPTAVGSWTVQLMASDNGTPSRTLYTNLALTIVAATASPPTITAQPQSQTVNAGANVTFTVSAGGAAPLSYQWRFGGVNIAGRTASALALSAVTTTQAGSYSVVVTNSAGAITSAPAVLTVNPLIAPAISTQPQSQTVNAGANVTMSVVASGTAPLSYQWRVDGVNLSGATAATLQLNSVNISQAGNYTVVVSNPAGSATSAPAVLSIYQPPFITTQPQSLMVLSGANATFFVVASGVPALSYQWQLAGTPLAGQTGTTLQLNGVTASQAGSYAVVITNLAGALTSAPAILTVNIAAVPPAILTQPQSQTVFAGTTVGFSVVASGTAPLSYQWCLGGTPLPGRTMAQLELNGVTLGQAGNYTVVVTNSAGAITSAPALLTVNAAIPPTITTQPLTQTVTVGAAVSFLVTATGTAPLRYQWRFGNSDLASATNSTLSLPAVTAGQSGGYVVVVSNLAGSVTSVVAVLTVNTPILVPPSITTQPRSLSVVVGSNATFAVVATGTAPLSYQWRLGSTNLVGRTNTSYSATNVNSRQAGDYTVVVSNPVGSITSAVARLTVTVARPGKDPRAPWKTFAGRYNGLLSDSNGVAQGSSGFFSFNLSPRGTFSASIRLCGGWNLSTSGALAADGSATTFVNRPGANPVSVDWALDLGGSDQITGTAIPLSGAWTAQLLGDRSVFNVHTNPCPYAGKYTLDLPGSPDDTNSPAGDSYGSVTVDQNGFVTLKGFLSDKTVAAQKVPLSKNGDWPLFVPLYSRTGALLAWIHFEDRAGDDFHGLATWIKPVLPTSKYFPAGFSVGSQIVGSRFNTGMTTAEMLHLTNGVAIFVGGDLPQPSTNTLQVVSSTVVAGSDPKRLKATFKPSTGLFRGTFLSPASGTLLPFGGAVMQKGNYGIGCFLGTYQSGSVLLQNSPSSP